MDPSDPNPIRVTTPTGTTTRPNLSSATYNQRWGGEESLTINQQEQSSPQSQLAQQEHKMVLVDKLGSIMLYLMLTKLKLGLLVNQTFTNSFLKFYKRIKENKNKLLKFMNKLLYYLLTHQIFWMILNSFCQTPAI